MKKRSLLLARAVICAVVFASLPFTQTTAAGKEREDVIASMSESNQNFLNNMDLLLSGTALSNTGSYIYDYYNAKHVLSFNPNEAGVLLETDYDKVILSLGTYRTRNVDGVGGAAIAWSDFLNTYDQPAETPVFKLGWVRYVENYDPDDADSYVIKSVAINGKRYDGTIEVPSAGKSTYTEINAELALDSEQLTEMGINSLSEIKTLSGRVEGYCDNRRVAVDSFYAQLKQ
ncbi:MAG: hypothetical protein PUB66_08230 [Oscillospiraceae bacterium]|nr:hypothetical protein [Oscillospiraceae bacterium]